MPNHLNLFLNTILRFAIVINYFIKLFYFLPHDKLKDKTNKINLFNKYEYVNYP